MRTVTYAEVGEYFVKLARVASFGKKSKKSNISLKIPQLQMEQPISFKIVSDTRTVRKTVLEKLYLHWSPSVSIDCSLEVTLYFQVVARYTLRI